MYRGALGLLLLFSTLQSLVQGAKTGNRTASLNLFTELEELSRLVAISYCVGNQGIKEPFECGGHRSWCEQFPNFELIETWDLGFLDSVSCGYVALTHAFPRRIVVAFRGSNSLSDTLYDLMTQPAEYVSYVPDDRCENCAVHSGFMSLWNATREHLVPTIQGLVVRYPDYELVLTGHSLGGAIAGLAALEFAAKGWKPIITTFGEPRFGNSELASYVDRKLVGDEIRNGASQYRRVTHVGDPVPLLPFENWGWRMHAGEIYIGKESLPIRMEDVQLCEGSNDPSCIQGTPNSELLGEHVLFTDRVGPVEQNTIENLHSNSIPGLPAEWRLWEILFAHRQYFWRLGLCWDPQNFDYPKRPDHPNQEL